MSSDPQEEPTQIPVDAPAPEAQERVDIVAPEPAYEPPAYASTSSDDGGSVIEEKPELVVAGAFAGAFIFAKIVKRITGG